MIRTVLIGVAGLAVLGGAPRAQPGAALTPSFDCARAATPGERGVCADPRLAAEDRALAQTYRRALAFATSPAAVRAGQRSALAVRNACTTRACLAGWYRERASALAAAASPPVGTCTETTVASTGSRLEGAPGSGSAIAYTDGLTQVSYDTVPGIAGSRAGDRVRLCVAARPRNCPVGDDRGTIYAAQNLRTGARWRAADSQHVCGGA